MIFFPQKRVFLSLFVSSRSYKFYVTFTTRSTCVITWVLLFWSALFECSRIYPWTWGNSGYIQEFRSNRLLSLFTESVCVKRPSKIVQKVTKIAIAYIFIQLLLTLLFFFGYVHSKMRLLFTNVPQSFKWYRCFSRLGIWAQSWSFHVRMRDLIIFWLMSDGNHDQKQPAFYNNESCCSTQLGALVIFSLFYNVNTWYVSSSIIWIKLVKPFHATGLLLYPPKTPENQKFSDIFKGYRKRPVAGNKLRSNVVYVLSRNVK